MTHTDLKSRAVDTIQRSYALLAGEQNLSPENDKVNRQLTSLVRTLTLCQPTEVSRYLLSTPELATERLLLPSLCGQAECEMEKYWARHLLECKGCDMTHFWYYAEYQELCRAEKELFAARRFDTISFLGSGALPLTAFLLSRGLPGTKITCVDNDSEACDLAEGLTKKMDLRGDIDIRCMDAIDYTPGGNELVVVASLLQGREAIYKHLEKRNCSMIVRDSEGAYQFLYKAAELPGPGFRQVSKTTPNSKRINTSRYFESVPGGAGETKNVPHEYRDAA